MLFIIEGKIKPYVRMTQRSKYSDPQAQEYLSSKANIGWQISSQMSQNDWLMMPDKTPLSAVISIKQPKALHRSDLDNIFKALLDAAQSLVYKNDCWIDKIVASREMGLNYITTFGVVVA